MSRFIGVEELYNELKQHMELPQVFNEIIIELDITKISTISIDGDVVEICASEMNKFYKVLEDKCKIPEYLEKLKIILKPSTAVRLEFRAVLVAKE